jgi:hypothetical protein
LFGSKFDVLLYDLTSTYFESPPPEDKQDKRRFGYCLHVTLRARLKPLAPGLTPRAVLDKLAAVQMLDVHFPTTDGRTLVMSRYMEFNADQKLLVKQLKLDRPPRPHPRITATATAARVPASAL